MHAVAVRTRFRARIEGLVERVQDSIQFDGNENRFPIADLRLHDDVVPVTARWPAAGDTRGRPVVARRVPDPDIALVVGTLHRELVPLGSDVLVVRKLETLGDRRVVQAVVRVQDEIRNLRAASQSDRP